MSRVRRREEITSATRELTVDDLARVYTQERDFLVRMAARKVQDAALAEEIVQEAFLKCMLAAPEIADIKHLAAYLNTTVTNLCISHARGKGVAPKLVAIDADMTAEQVAAIVDTNSGNLDESLVSAEDSAIVREAISRLSESDRTVLLAEAFEGLSAQEIANRYGMKVDYVYNALARARKNLRNVLETWVIDEATGATAADLLSKTYKKAAENGKKIGSAALSLVLLVAAFFGFWNNPSSPTPVALPTTSSFTPPATTAASPTAPSSSSPVATAEQSTQALQEWAIDYLSKVGPLGWPGLDSNGIPVGFTVNDGEQVAGLAMLSSDPFVMNTNTGVVSTASRFTTFQNGLNVILSQKISFFDGQIKYSVEPMVRVGGSWVELELANISTEVTKLADGSYLLTSWMLTDLAATAKNPVVAGYAVGTDLRGIPAVLATRIHTTQIGSPIFGQAVQVLQPIPGGQS